MKYEDFVNLPRTSNKEFHNTEDVGVKFRGHCCASCFPYRDMIIARHEKTDFCCLCGHRGEGMETVVEQTWMCRIKPSIKSNSVRVDDSGYQYRLKKWANISDDIKAELHSACMKILVWNLISEDESKTIFSKIEDFQEMSKHELKFLKAEGGE